VFASFNRGALSNPKVTTVLDDGFNFMKYGRNRYDVISLDPFTPRDPGSARLYTREFLLSVRDRLKEGGIVVLWAYPATVRTASFRVALKTFQAVFPHATVWTSPVDNMLLFVATPVPLKLDTADLAARLAARPQSKDYRYHIESAEDFRSLLLFDEAAVRRIVALEDRPLFTVDRPNLEFLYLNDPSPALSALRATR
jgi:spermidine synthase